MPEFKDFKKKLHELSGISDFRMVKGPLKKRKQAKVLRCTIDYTTTTTTREKKEKTNKNQSTISSRFLQSLREKKTSTVGLLVSLFRGRHNFGPQIPMEKTGASAGNSPTSSRPRPPRYRLVDKKVVEKRKAWGFPKIVVPPKHPF